MHTVNGVTHCNIFNPDGSDELVRIEYDYTPEYIDRPFFGGDRRGDNYETEIVEENIDVLSVEYFENSEWVNLPARFLDRDNMDLIHNAIRKKIQSHAD